jgi:RNA-directed DNA polymerase
MERLTRFITRRLKLVVNEAKRTVARPWERQRLGLSLTRRRAPTGRRAAQAVKRVKTRLRTRTQRAWVRRRETLSEPVNSDLRGWLGSVGGGQTPSVLGEGDAWLRRRLRRSVWQPWGRTGDRE